MSDCFPPPPAIPPRTSSSGGTPASPSKGRSGRRGSRSCVPEAARGVAGTQGSQGSHSSQTIQAAQNDQSDAAGDGGQWAAGKERIVQGPYEYMVQQPGKDIRRQLIAAFNEWLRVSESSLAIIAKVVVMLHTASLLVDDVEDSSVLRRGVPVAHNIFGIAQTINSANYTYFLALEEIQKLHNPAAIDIYVRELLNLHRGQGMDLFWRDTLTCPSEDDYLEMVTNKTGGLFRLAVKLMQAESEAKIDCVPLVNVLGLIFQICDDYLNLSHHAYTNNKGLCEDLTEGKFSFPIIHSIRAAPHNLQLLNILRQRTRDDEVKRYAVAYLESTGSFAYTRTTVLGLRRHALDAIERLEREVDVNGAAGGVAVRAMLEKIVNMTLGELVSE